MRVVRDVAIERAGTEHLWDIKYSHYAQGVPEHSGYVTPR
jgi:hypothetical protein